MLSLSYAKADSGKSAGGIGWFNFDNLSLQPGDIVKGLSAKLLDGSTISFDISNTTLAGDGFTIDSLPIPTSDVSAFGTIGYTKITGNIALQSFSEYIKTGTSTKITLSNINVIDQKGENVPNYSLIAVSTEIANSNDNPKSEIQKFDTTGEPWQELDWLGKNSSPEVTGYNTKKVTMISYSDNSGSPVIFTNSPTSVSATIDSNTGLSSVAFGIAVTTIKVNKHVNNKLHENDNFLLSLNEDNTSKSDLFSETAAGNSLTVFARPGDTYTISENMSNESVNSLSDYTRRIVWINSSDGFPQVPINTTSVTLELGEVFTVDIYYEPRQLPPPSRGINIFKS